VIARVFTAHWPHPGGSGALAESVVTAGQPIQQKAGAQKPRLKLLGQAPRLLRANARVNVSAITGWYLATTRSRGKITEAS
jgi:hypothetical protein